MNLAERIEALASQNPHLWTVDACGVTRADTQIPALLHPEAYVPDTDRTRVLLLSGLTGQDDGRGQRLSRAGILHELGRVIAA